MWGMMHVLRVWDREVVALSKRRAMVFAVWVLGRLGQSSVTEFKHHCGES